MPAIVVTLAILGITNLPISEKMKIQIIDKVGETEYRLIQGSNSRIQLETFLAHLAFVGEGLQDSKKK